MKKRKVKQCDGTMLGFMKVFPNKDFRITNQDNIAVRCGETWKAACICGKPRKRCLIHNPKIRCYHKKGKVRQKEGCPFCTPRIACIHTPGKLKRTCFECDPNLKCPHENGIQYKVNCVDCNPKLKCPHDNNILRKQNCIDCNPHLECIHVKRKQKAHCITCTPSNACEHGKYKYNCITCKPSLACSKCGLKYRQYKSEYCGRCNPDFVESYNYTSKVCCEFMDALAIEQGVIIAHRHLNRVTKKWIGEEYRLPRYGRKAVDGHIPRTNIVIEFLGDEYHGHHSKWSINDDYLKIAHYQYLFEKTQRIFKKMTDLGYKVYYIWECQYAKKPVFTSIWSLCTEFDGVLRC